MRAATLDIGIALSGRKHRAGWTDEARNQYKMKSLERLINTSSIMEEKLNLTQITFWDGQQVCPLGQGTYQMGRRRNEEIKALRRGIDLGLTLIDTAEMYGTEDLVGEAVRDCREQAFIVSKVLPSNASYEGTKRACERSLQRLGTDYIDLYLLHWIGRYPFSETVRALAGLQQEGKIRQWGPRQAASPMWRRMPEALTYP